MKKIVIFILLFLCSLNTFCQIQRTFFGCSFGCSKQLVIQKIKSLGYTISKTSEGFCVDSKPLHTIKFGGYTWDFIEFKFYKNSLYNVLFCASSKNSQQKKNLSINFNELRGKLDKKYSKTERNCWNDNIVSWTDKKTGLICRYLYANDKGESFYQDAYDRRLNLYLWYYDKLTYKNKNKSENDEL